MQVKEVAFQAACFAHAINITVYNSIFSLSVIFVTFRLNSSHVSETTKESFQTQSRDEKDNLQTSALVEKEKIPEKRKDLQEEESADQKPPSNSFSRSSSFSSSSSSSFSKDEVTVIQQNQPQQEEVITPYSVDPVTVEKKDNFQEQYSTEEYVSGLSDDQKAQEAHKDVLSLPAEQKPQRAKDNDSSSTSEESSSSSSSSDEGSFEMVSTKGPAPEPPSSTVDSEYQNYPPVIPEDDYYRNFLQAQEIQQVPQSSPKVQTPIATPSKRREDIMFTSGWRKVVRLMDLIKARLVEEETVRKLEFGEVDEDKVAGELQQYLTGSEPIAGVILVEDGSKLSLYDATKNQILRRGTAVGLLEAQAATGSIINPYNGEKMSVEEATKVGLIDPQLAAVLVRAERAVVGFKFMTSDKPLSLFDAMKRKLVMESHGIRLLEAQIATGGIIDPYANHRIPVEVAFERGLFDQRLNKILESPDDDTKGFFDPNTDENLTYLELIERCVIDKDTGLRLLPIFKVAQKQDYWKK